MHDDDDFDADVPLIEYDSDASSVSYISENSDPGSILSDTVAIVENRPDVSICSVVLGENPVYTLSVSQANRQGTLCLVAAGTGDDTVAILAVAISQGEAPKLRLIQTITGFPDTVSAVQFSPDSQFLAACSYAKKEDSEITENAQARIYRMNGSLVEKQLTGLSTDKPVAELVNILEGPVDDIEWVSWNPRSLECALGGREGKVWIYELEKYTNTFECVGTLNGHSRRVTAGCYHPAEQLSGDLVTASKDGKLIVWSSQRKAVLTMDPSNKWHRHRINGIACHSVEPLVATAANDDSVRIVNIRSGKEVQGIRSHKDSVESVAFKDNYLATGGLDGLVTVVDCRNMSVIKRFYHDKGSGVTCVLWAGNGRLLSCGTDGTVRVWSLQDDNCRVIMSGHNNVVSCAGILPMENYFISGGFDSTVKLFYF